MSIGSGFEKYGPLYAPPKDAGGGVIQSSFLDSKENVLGEHPYVLVDQWEADASSRDLGKMKNFRDKLLAWEKSDPRVLSDKPTQEAMNNLLRRVNVLIGQEEQKPRQAEVLTGGRNTFETWLLDRGFPQDKLLPKDGSPEAAKENWDFKKSFFVTESLYQMVEIDGNFRARKLGTISSVTQEVEKFSLKMLELAQSSGNKIGGAESKYAKETSNDLVYILGLFDSIVSQYNEYFGATQSLETLGDMFNIAKSGEKQQTFANWAFDVLDLLPPLVLKNEVDGRVIFELDKKTFGERMLMASREIITRGRRMKKSPNENELDKSTVRWDIWDPKKGGVPVDEKQISLMQYTVERVRGERGVRAKKLRANPSKAKGENKGIFPFVAFGEVGIVEGNFGQLALDLSAVVKDGKADLAGKSAAMLSSFMLAAYNFEDAVQDCWPNKDNPQGRPVGVSYVSRMLHVAEYMWKVFKSPEDRQGPVNKYLIGTFRKMINGLFDSVCYKGQSLTERIVDTRTKKWVDDEKGQGVVDPKYLPPEINRNWSTAVLRSALVFTNMMKGLKEGNISKVAEFKLEEGKITLNQPVIEALVTFYRLVTEYRTFTEAGSALAVNKELVGDKKVQENLDTSFSIFEIRDKNGKVIESLDTRFFDFYEANLQELAAWIQNTVDEQKLGTDPGFLLDARWVDPSQRTLNVAGKPLNHAYIQLNVDVGRGIDTLSEVEQEKIKRNLPKKLIERYLLSHFLYVIVRQTMEAHILDKEDYMGLLMLFSTAYKESYRTGGERGPWLKFIHMIGQSAKGMGIPGAEMLETEVPDFSGPDLFTLRQGYQFLSSLGIDIKWEEVLKNAQKFSGDLGKLLGGK